MKSAKGDEPPECVVFVHGLGRSSRSFLLTRKLIERNGYSTVVINYPSRDHTIEVLAKHLSDQLRDLGLFDGRFDQVHMVTHSMGGIVTRCWLQHEVPERLGKIVMLGPPNGGSGIIDAFRGNRLFDWFVGPAGLQLGTGAESLPNGLHPVPARMGIIAGNRSMMPLSGRFVGRNSDGKVSIESTRLDEMSDHITLPVGHTFMMNSPQVMAQILTFLRTGKFDPSMSGRRAMQSIMRVR